MDKEETTIKLDENYKAFHVQPKPKTRLVIGKEQAITAFLDTKFNWFQKKMWKILLNIEVEDIE